MAQKVGRQSEWPRVQREPDGWVLKPDGYENTGRQFAGPLRYGTEPRVGPKGGAVALDRSEATDMGMDRVTPRDFDPMGTSRERSGTIPSELLSREIRGRRDR